MVEIFERLLSSLASLATIACFVLELAREIRHVRKDDARKEENAQ